MKLYQKVNQATPLIYFTLRLTQKNVFYSKIRLAPEHLLHSVYSVRSAKRKLFSRLFSDCEQLHHVAGDGLIYKVATQAAMQSNRHVSSLNLNFDMRHMHVRYDKCKLYC